MGRLHNLDKESEDRVLNQLIKYSLYGTQGLVPGSRPAAIDSLALFASGLKKAKRARAVEVLVDLLREHTPAIKVGIDTCALCETVVQQQSIDR